MNLSTNCSKHILAELKHDHIEDQEVRTGLKKPATALVARAEFPGWSASVISRASSNADRQLPDDDECDRDTGTPMGELIAIDARLDAACGVAPAANKRKSTVRDYMDAVAQLAAEHRGDNHSFNRVKGKSRGNHGFFRHLSDQRALHPRHSGEPAKAYEARLMAMARLSWKERLSHTT